MIPLVFYGCSIENKQDKRLRKDWYMRSQFLSRFSKVVVLTSILAVSWGTFAGPKQVAGPAGDNGVGILNHTEAQLIAETAKGAYAELPTRARVANIENSNQRIFLTKVLDTVDAAQSIDQMTGTEQEALAQELFTTVATMGTAIDAMAIGVIGEPSCVQNCWNEYQNNIRGDCDFWCRFGYALLWELCVADCLVPG